MNGVSVSERVQVKHGGRILLGNHHLYRLSCPHTVDPNEEEGELMDYEQAMKEISINELSNGEAWGTERNGVMCVCDVCVCVCVCVDPVISKVQENLSKKHEEEKEGV